MLGKNDSYVSRNISPGLFKELQINFFALIDNNGNIRFSVLNDATGWHTDNLPENLKTILVNNKYLTGKNNIQKGLSGILLLDNSPYIFISKPVLPNDAGTAFPAGTMIVWSTQ
jgi:sensor domain CHASE-containing protein